MITITLINGLYHVQGPKCLLVLTKAELIRALQARLAPDAAAPRRGAGRRG